MRATINVTSKDFYMLEKIEALRLKDYTAIIGFLLIIVTLLLPLSTGVTMQYQGAYEKTTPAYAFIFGGEVQRTLVVSGVTTHEEGVLYRAAPIAFAAWIILLSAFILVVIALLLIYYAKKDWGKWLLPLSGVLLVVSAVLFFSSTDDALKCIVSEIPSTFTVEAMHKLIIEFNFKLGFGFIGTGVFAIISGVFFCLSGAMFLKKESPRQESSAN